MAMNQVQFQPDLSMAHCASMRRGRSPDLRLPSAMVEARAAPVAGIQVTCLSGHHHLHLESSVEVAHRCGAARTGDGPVFPPNLPYFGSSLK